MIEEDLNANIANIVDLINIKNLPEMICEYLHSKGKSKYGNLRKFYSTLLDYFGEDIKTSYLNRILKYLSSDKPSEIYLLNDINDNIYDKELKAFTKCLVRTINEYDDCSNLYELLNRKINFIFYESEEEYCKIKTYNNNSNYEDFIFELLKHAFKNYKESLPGITGRSLFIQSQTMNSRTPTRTRFLNASSLLGNDMATINLYCSLISEDYNTAVKVLLRAKENEMVLWSIAYDLENNFLNKEIIQMIKNRFKHIFDRKDEFISHIIVTEKGKNKLYDVTLLLAYQIYYYCYTEYNFTKAGNSLGKLLLFDIVSYDNDRNESIKLAKKFLYGEIKRGNINAITNIAIYYYMNPEDSDYDYNQIKKWLQTSASFGDRQGNYYYARVLFEEGNYDEAFKYMKYSSQFNDGKSFLLLGQYYELKDNFENAIKSYKQAIMYKQYNAAYYLALLYFNLKEVQKDNSIILEEMGKDYLEKYYHLFSKEIKDKAEKLINKKF